MHRKEAPRRGYYDAFRKAYAERREALLAGLAMFQPCPPEGTYFAMVEVPGEPCSDAFVRRLIREVGVAAIPPASFYLHPEEGAGLVRFAFCKRVETLRRAATLLLEARAQGKL